VADVDQIIDQKDITMADTTEQVNVSLTPLILQHIICLPRQWMLEQRQSNLIIVHSLISPLPDISPLLHIKFRTDLEISFTTRSLVSHPQTEEHDPQFEPVIKLTEQVEAKTGEEDDEVLFKMYVCVIPPFSHILLHRSCLQDQSSACFASFAPFSAD
jgi:hypothetical protein